MRSKDIDFDGIFALISRKTTKKIETLHKLPKENKSEKKSQFFKR